jgi:outer membrane protein assembly factor BamA
MKIVLRVMVLLVLVVPVRGDESARFLIERIDVRHLVHASPEVIKSESRLREGQTVTENELRDACSRIKRLPFVLDATFSLERGSVRDAYVLVINVNETRPLFYLSEVVPYARARNSVRTFDMASLLGGRIFAGRSGVFHLALIAGQSERPFERDFTSTIQAGYTRYGLFHNRAFATLTINHELESTKTHGATLPGGVIGVALAPNETLTISYTALDVADSQVRWADRVIESRFAYDTTNEPFFPTDGSLLSVAPIVALTDRSGEVSGLFTIHDTAAGFELRGARYWPLDGRFSLGASGEGGVVHVRRHSSGVDTFADANVHYGSATLRLSRAIGDINADSDRRIELSVRYVPKAGDYVFPPRDTGTLLSVTWVRRNAWGVLRFGLGYTW